MEDELFEIFYKINHDLDKIYKYGFLEWFEANLPDKKAKADELYDLAHNDIWRKVIAGKLKAGNYQRVLLEWFDVMKRGVMIMIVIDMFDGEIVEK